MAVSDLKREVKKTLAQLGWFVFHIHSQSYHSYNGISDLIAIKRGRVLFIELKTATGKLSPGQVAFGDKIKEHGGEYHVIRSTDELLKLM